MIGIIVQLAAAMATFVGIKLAYQNLIFNVEKGIRERSLKYYSKRTMITCPNCGKSISLEDHEKDLILFNCTCGLIWEDYATHTIAKKFVKLSDKI